MINKFAVMFFLCMSFFFGAHAAEKPDCQLENKRSGSVPGGGSRPEIVTRSQWRAKKPLSNIKMRPQYPQLITIHHSAVRQNKRHMIESKMRNLQAFSQKRARVSSSYTKKAWADVPYHFYIASSGRIAEGRDICFAGDTNTNYDTAHHIQIVLEGNFEIKKPTLEQLKSLRQLVAWQAIKWNVPASRIQGHKSYASTVCPGKNMEQHIAALQKNITGKAD